MRRMHVGKYVGNGTESMQTVRTTGIEHSIVPTAGGGGVCVHLKLERL